ncbi:hypothetical protein CI109_104208 [Kwoniella shandongensis]|uniref:Alpha-1,6-mannosyltransferase n=1 Tax=Kwoniella shandongensis TaxID=1734106 RepID=A0AAJ8LKZ5_9TREE
MLLPRHLRFGTPAKVLLAFITLVLYLSFPFTNTHPPSAFASPREHDRLSNAPLSELVDIYEQVRIGLLDAKHYDSKAATEKLRSPTYLPDGSINLDADFPAYLNRLRRFVDSHFQHVPRDIHEGARNSLKDMIRRLPPTSRPDTFPSKVWSTHPFGLDGVEEGFELWQKLLPVPLSPRLADRISKQRNVDFLRPAREGSQWEVTVTDDNGLDKWMSQWTAEKLSRGIVGEGEWASFWGKLEHGVLRADVFRYMSMFTEGGIYSDSDTMAAAAVTSQQPKDRLNPRATLDTEDTQHNHTSTISHESHLSRRAPIQTLDDPSTILNPDISIVLAIEWDSAIGRTWSMWKQWTWFRFRRSWPDCCFPRGLEMVQNLLVSKPFHPIMLDTLATIAELVESGVARQLSPLDLTGPGPFSDAVFRYLLVQYGATPDDLRALRGPVRIGDVIILQEEAWHAPSKAIQRLLSHVKSLGSKLGDKDPWRFGLGWSDWQSGGIKVAYHGLTGIWKGKG